MCIAVKSVKQLDLLASRLSFSGQTNGVPEGKGNCQMQRSRTNQKQLSIRPCVLHTVAQSGQSSVLFWEAGSSCECCRHQKSLSRICFIMHNLKKKSTLISSLPDYDSLGSGEGAKRTEVNVLVFFYQD